MANPTPTRRQSLAQMRQRRRVEPARRHRSLASRPGRRPVETPRRRPSLPSRPGRRPTPSAGLPQRLRGKRGKPAPGPMGALTSAIAKVGSTAGKQASRRPGKKPLAGGLLAGVGLGAAALLKRRRAEQDDETPQPRAVVVEATATPDTPPVVADTAGQDA